jgi:hypothetical protein
VQQVGLQGGDQPPETKELLRAGPASKRQHRHTESFESSGIDFLGPMIPHRNRRRVPGAIHGKDQRIELPLQSAGTKLPDEVQHATVQ